MQLLPCRFGRKAPLDFGIDGIARCHQLLNGSLERCFVTDAPGQTLTAEDAPLDRGDV